MFDIGFSELLLLAVVALIVVGPERLPVVARTAGLWINRVNRSMQTARDTISRELHNEEVKKAIAKTARSDQNTTKDDN